MLSESDYFNERINKSKSQKVFKRGVMNFEDFNYDSYNEFILIDKTKH